MAFVEVFRISDIQLSDEQRNTIFDSFRKKQMVVIPHQTPGVNIDDRISPITTYEVVIVFFEKICRVVCRVFRVEYA